MNIRSVEFDQTYGLNRWHIDGLLLDDVNLIVGKNASGKTKAIGTILTLSRLLSGESNLTTILGDASYNAHFVDPFDTFEYEIQYTNGVIVEEIFRSGTRGELLRRGKGGEGRLFAEKVGDTGDFIDFQTPEHELAAVVRRDSIQHSYFEPLYQWAKSLRYFEFGSKLGKDVLAFATKDRSRASTLNEKDTTKVVPTFHMGYTLFGEPFKDLIKADMQEIGYPIEDIVLTRPTSFNVVIEPAILGEPTILAVQEVGLPALTDQGDMSQGMFRALSVIIHLDYLQLANKPGALLIDDIGEGLDFERSCALIELVMRKATASKSQLIMSTNDRFIMNKVPLKYWSVLQREAGSIRVFNYHNSKDVFDNFKFTGLSNFDFLAYDVISGPRDEHANGDTDR